MSAVRTGDRDTATVRRPRVERSAGPAAARRMVEYDPVLRLTMRHDYDDAPAGGLGIVVSPSARTKQTLDAHGLLFREDDGGCVVLGDRVARRAPAQSVEDKWLTFLIDAGDPHFALVSDLDLDAGSAVCLYGTPPAVEGEAADGAARLPVQPLPILPRNVSLPLARGNTVAIRRGGDTVMSVEWRSDGTVVVAPDAPMRLDPITGQVHVDLSDVPDGRYVVDARGRPPREGIRVARPRAPVAIVELPLPGGGDASTRRVAADRDACTHYEVVFGTRRTIWKYSIVARAGSGPLDNLSIRAAANGAGAEVAVPPFLGPFEEMLPNGTRAYQFLSSAPIAIRRRSPVRLRLTGRRKDRMTRDGVLVEYLPVPAKHQLGLLTGRDRERLGAAERFCSEMFVHV